MKKHLLTLSAMLFAGASSFAQITVDQWDVAGVNTVIRQAADTNPTVGPGPSGANVSWNLAAMQQHVVDTLLFTNPNWTPYGSSFPGANLAVQFGSQNAYAYLNNQSNGLFAMGQYGDFGLGPMAAEFNPDDQMIAFPSTYNTTYNNTSVVTITMPFTQIPGADSIRIKSTTIKTCMVDGWGNVTTPLGMFPSLRQKDYRRTYDTIWAHAIFPPGWQMLQANADTNYHFAWWADGVGFPLVEMDSALDGTIDGVNWLQATPAPGGYSEPAVYNNIIVFPNPASGQVRFDLSKVEAEKVEILDAAGQVVAALSVTGDLLSADVSTLSAGIYFFRVSAASGAFLGMGRFSVAH
ncbi:MAG: T9SS type A sorting domain-containing protein [Bacteroidota bacterium]